MELPREDSFRFFSLLKTTTEIHCPYERVQEAKAVDAGALLGTSREVGGPLEPQRAEEQNMESPN